VMQKRRFYLALLPSLVCWAVNWCYGEKSVFNVGSSRSGSPSGEKIGLHAS
jgi:hypothetical protein